MVKTLKNLLLQKQYTDDLETWYVALSMYVSTTKVTNYDPGLTLTYFMSRSNLITQAFVWKKVKIIYFLELIAALGLKVA